MSVGAEVGTILDPMEQRQAEIAASVAATLLSEVDGYQLLGSGSLRDELQAQCERHIRLLLKMARTGRPPQPEDVEFIRQVGIRRADELSPLHALLQGYRVGQRLVWEWIVREAGTSPDRMREALALTSRLFDYSDVAASVVTAAYLEQSQRLEADAERVKRHLLDDLLAGRVMMRDRPSARAAAMGLHFATDYIIAVGVLRQTHALLRSTGQADRTEHDGLRRVADAVQRYAQTGAKPPFVVVREQEVISLIPINPGQADRIQQQLVEAVEMLRATRCLHVAMGMSAACHGFVELPRAYDEARRATEHVGESGGVITLADVPPFEYILALADGAAARSLPAWADRLIEEDSRDGGVLLETLLGYVDADLNIGRTATRLSVHSNTVQNRLRKIRQLTGLSTRHFSDLVQIVTAIRLAHPSGPHPNSSPW